MNESSIKKNDNAWKWVPSLYFSQGLPNVMVATVSVIMLKDLGKDNSDIAFWTSWFYLPWVIKGLWGPIVDIMGTHRGWIISMQLLMGAGFGCIALTLPFPFWWQAALILFSLIAFSSATHDIAADAFYMEALSEHRQAWFVGIRSTFYRLAMIVGQGGVVVFVGLITNWTGKVQFAWTCGIILVGLVYITCALYHWLILPHPISDSQGAEVRHKASYLSVIKDFFALPGLGITLAFVLLYRLGESQLVKIATPFLKDQRMDGGMGLENAEVGMIYGVIGATCLLCGGILGGIAVSQHGLKKWIWPMVCAIHLPNLAFVYLAYMQPESSITILACVALEQFGYGFGFAAFMLYMLCFVESSRYKGAHYAILTGFMALGMMLPGMISGWIQQKLGYTGFFTWVVIATIPGILLIPFLKIPESFGRRADSNS